jgi:hypothetical protein
MGYRVLLNKSCNRISTKLSCFSKLFFDELFDVFESDKNFWNNDLLHSYMNNYQQFISIISKKHNYPIDKLNDNIPVILVNNWRYNNKLIDYIIKRSTKKDYQKNYYYLPVDENVNGLNDVFVIRDVDYEDYENHEIIYNDNGEEILNSKINYKEIIDDLKSMIEDKYKYDEIEFYLKLNNVNKYTKRIFKYTEWIDGRWCEDDEYDISPDTY